MLNTCLYKPVPGSYFCILNPANKALVELKGRECASTNRSRIDIQNAECSVCQLDISVTAGRWAAFFGYTFNLLFYGYISFTRFAVLQSKKRVCKQFRSFKKQHITASLLQSLLSVKLKRWNLKQIDLCWNLTFGCFRNSLMLSSNSSIHSRWP